MVSNSSDCQLDSSAYILPSREHRIDGLFDKVDDQDGENSFTEEISPYPSSYSSLHGTCQMIEKITESIIKFKSGQVDDFKFCRDCVPKAIQISKKILLSKQREYRALSLELHRRHKQEIETKVEMTNVEKTIVTQGLRDIEVEKEVIADETRKLQGLMNELCFNESEILNAIDQTQVEINLLEQQKYLIDDEIRVAINVIDQMARESAVLNHFQSINALLRPLFHISSLSDSSNSIYIINGFRLKYVPETKIQLTWNEINAAWGQVSTLLTCLRNRHCLSPDIHIPTEGSSNIINAVKSIRVVAYRTKSVIHLINESGAACKYFILCGKNDEVDFKLNVNGTTMMTYQRSVVLLCLAVSLTIFEVTKSEVLLKGSLRNLFESARKGLFNIDDIEDDDWERPIHTPSMISAGCLSFTAAKELVQSTMMTLRDLINY